VVFEYIVTVPDYPSRVEGRANLIELYRGYGDSFYLDSCGDLAAYHDREASVVVLEYSTSAAPSQRRPGMRTSTSR